MTPGSGWIRGRLGNELRGLRTSPGPTALRRTLS